MTKTQKIKKASAFAKFRLLMWKNFLIQWRQRAQTMAEVLLPVATMALVLILRSQIEPTYRDTFNFPSFAAHSIDNNETFLILANMSQMSVAYSPKNPVLEDIILRSSMALVALNIIPTIRWVLRVNNASIFENFPPDFIENLPEFIENLPDFIENLPDFIDNLPPDIIENLPELNQTVIQDFLRQRINVEGFDNSGELTNLYKNENATRMVLAAVQFDDALRDITQLPDDMSYILRFPERPRLNSFFHQGGRSWRSDLVFPVFPSPGPRQSRALHGGTDPGYVVEMFIALQHLISSEIIANLTDSSVRNFSLSLQRYPHPSYQEDMAIEVLQFIFPMFVMLSFSYTAVNIVKAVTLEKELHLKESMKIMGLPTALHWLAWFCKQFIFLIIIAALVVMLLKVNWFTNEEGFSDYSVFTNTPWTILMFFLLLYMACIIFFCFMMSGFFAKANTAAVFTGVIWFLTYAPAFFLAMDVNMSAAVQAVTCLSINSAMAYGFQVILSMEATGGLQWGDFFTPTTPESSRFLFGHVVLMMVLNCIIYMLVALYLEQVKPGSLGVPQPWYFPFLPSFWFPSTKKQFDKSIDVDDTHEIIMEKDPLDLPVGVKISNLTKVFKKNTAVDHLSLNIYDDQITILLGHNGAGKSTTISMLTGNIEPTKGNVLIAGYDIGKQTLIARAHIGLCPQHNVLFNELTVREHVEFFARLKGFTGQELIDDIDSIIDKLELENKRHYRAAGLSGGQKRRLSVGVALCGSSRVVLLDEPTSGMDPSSRRALWELLQREKKGRSIILTTHFMDEADILGDRVAIMATGRLQCVGSPYFLKQHYGVGYTLVVVKDENFSELTCTKIIGKYISDITIKEDRGTEVTYGLSNEYSYAFEDVLKDLESNRSVIAYKNYGLIPTTMEDVFMSVGSDVVPVTTDSDDAATTSDYTANDTLASELDSSQQDLFRKDTVLTGSRLWIQQVLTMWLKLWLVWSRSYGMVIIQLLVPVLQISATLLVMNYALTFVEQIRLRPLTLTEGFFQTETWLQFNGTDASSLGALASQAYKVPFEQADSDMKLKVIEDKPINEFYLKQGADPHDMSSLRQRVVIGATFEESGATAWFSNFGYHDIAISLATVHSAVLRALRPNATLKVYNQPLEAAYADQTDMQMLITMMAMQLGSGVGSSIAMATAVFLFFYIKERVTRAKLLQKAAGVEPATLWGAAAIFDWFWFLIISCTILATCAAFQVIGLSTAEELGRLFLVCMVYGAAMLPLNYLFSLMFVKPATGFVITFFINLLLGMMGSQIVETLFTDGLETENVAHILDMILQFVPLYGLVTSTRQLNSLGLTKWYCMEMCDFILMLPDVDECTMDTVCKQFEACCIPENPHFMWGEHGILRYLVAMLGSCVVLWIVLMLIEYRVLQRVFTRRRAPPPIDESLLDADVIDERRHVEHVAGAPRADQNLVTTSLSKYYGNHLAVNQVSFSVGAGECFGLLGVNGAGKTTTFKMLMGDETVSYGDAYVKGHSVRSELRKVHENIGYCPQFDAVFSELTGRETLRLFALLRGLRDDTTSAMTLYLAANLGFTKHLDKQVKQYSGGNKRKLSTAVSMMGFTPLVFLDEPTTGVDPAAKRQVWRAVRRATHSGRGVVLTSHSMEECEALCSRLTIMVNGQFQCLGTPQHLKNKFSQGFTLTIKLRIDNDSPDPVHDLQNLAAVKAFVALNFEQHKLMEEYRGLLTYYLQNGDMPWSRMFGIMELAKRELSVEDYSISQTTLEQIFLQFTKYQQQVIEQTAGS